MKNYILYDIIKFLEQQQDDLPVSLSGDEERREYAKTLLEGIRLYSLEKARAQWSDEVDVPEFEMQIKEAIQYDHRRQTLDFFNSIEEKKTIKKTNREAGGKIIHLRRGVSRIIAIAASVAVLAVAGWWFWAGGDRGSLYEEYYNLPAHEYLLRSADDVQPDVKSAFTYFDEEDYESAIPLLSALFDQSRDPDFKFYEAIAYMELKEFQEANTLFSELVRISPGYTEVRWYYALSLMESGYDDLAVEQLEKVADSDHFRSDIARDLLRDLNK